MTENLRQRLQITPDRLDALNAVLLNPDMRIVNEFLDVVAKYGSPEEINQKAARAMHLPSLLDRVAAENPGYRADLEWLTEQRNEKRFISVADYRRKVLGDKVDQITFNDDYAVTLEISASQYFPWLREIAQKAIDDKSLMPGRFIRVRKMKEQEADGDLLAFAAAMQIIGASYVETLDTKGTDGSNVHLGGPETITGYFGGSGQPNEYALKWLDEYLYYYTNSAFVRCLISILARC